MKKAVPVLEIIVKPLEMMIQRRILYKIYSFLDNSEHPLYYTPKQQFASSVNCYNKAPAFNIAPHTHLMHIYSLQN